MEKRIHGGDWAGYQREYGAPPLDFSASVSPLGVPESVRSAICAAAAEADRYPDPSCRALCAAIGAHEGVAPERVLCGAGASDLLFRAVLAARPRQALLAEPCFGEYAASLASVGCAIRRFPLPGSFLLSEEYLSEINHNIDIAILCNPNNPTGLTVEPELLRRIARRCGETGTRLVLDECFVDFLDEPERHTLKGLLDECRPLLILRAFTKLYGMAGLRLGYALCGDAAYLDAMRRCAPPWAVSSVAQAAGLAALRDRDYVNQVRALVRSERRRLAAGLTALGLRVVPGEANFLLFQSSTPLDGALRARGLLLRRCGDFAGLDEDWYRAAVRTPEDDDRLLAALRELLG